MKRVLSVILVFALLLLAGCAQGEPQSTPNENTQPIVLVDKDGVKITYTGIKIVQYLPNQSGTYMLTVGLIINNASAIDITVLPTDASVNNIVKAPVSGTPLTVISGKESVTGFSFANLDGTGISSIDDAAKIEFRLSVVNNDNFVEMFHSETITIGP